MLHTRILAPLTMLAALLAPGCDQRASWVDSSLEASVAAPARARLAARAAELDRPAASSASPTATTKPAPKPVVESAPPPPPPADLGATLQVKRLIVAEGVKRREPVGEGGAFTTATPRVYAFLEITNPARVASEVSVSITPRGEAERGRVTLDIGASPRWRTWSFTRLARTPGAYDVVVYDGDGDEIGRTEFEVTSPTATPTAAVEAKDEPRG
ncbi:MAG: DUF2914 domain-containing protein [Myxococcota bacterium]